MVKTDTAPEQLRKGAKVVARVEMREVPMGSPGRVSMVTGSAGSATGIRFDNGVSLGSIDRKRLATPEQWKRHLAGDGDGDEDGAAEVGGAGVEAGDGGDADGSGKATPAGTIVPQKLLDRSAAARTRLGG